MTIKEVSSISLSANELQGLEPSSILWSNPSFQDWVTGIREELKALKELPWGLSTPKQSNMNILFAAFGMRWPVDSRELYETFLATKAVVHYVEERLRLVESQSNKYHKLLKKIQEREEKKNVK